MKISKAKLLAAIDAVQAAEKQKIADYETAKRLYAARQKALWIREEMPRLKNLRNMISKALANHTLVTREMVEDALGSSRRGSYYSSQVPTWSMPNVTEFEIDGHRFYKIVPQTSKYDSLRLALNAIEDDTVTPSALTSIGFRNLGDLFRAAIA